MNYLEWEKSVPSVIKKDSLWTVEAYRLSLFLADISWHDATKLSKDRARFYEYALGSARESRGWYYKARHVLGEAVGDHRMGLTTQIVRLLIKMVPDQRGYKITEDSPEYITKNPLLEDVPF